MCEDIDRVELRKQNCFCVVVAKGAQPKSPDVSEGA